MMGTSYFIHVCARFKTWTKCAQGNRLTYLCSIQALAQTHY